MNLGPLPIFKWSVRKVDGAWHVLDATGQLRHATSSWVIAMTYARMGADELPNYGPTILRHMRRMLPPPPNNGGDQ